MEGFTTRAIHGKPGQGIKDSHNALRLPVYDSVAFEFESSQAIADAFQGKAFAHSYSRITNPTVADLEQKVNYLAGGIGAIALSSGMAAITNTVLGICSTGDNIITSKFLFGNTYSLFEKTLKEWGLEIRYVDFTKPEEVEKAINSRTRALFMESISNPQLYVFDIPAITAIAKKHAVLTLIDNTVTTPYLFDASRFGVDLQIISSTKYMSGGATGVGGIFIDQGSYDWSNNPKIAPMVKKIGPYAFLQKMRKEIYRNMGACLSPQNAYLQTLGLETLALRIGKSCDNTLELAKFLEKQNEVKRVNYPGLKENEFYSRAKELFNGRFGGILTFELAGQKECFAFMDALKVIRRATNLNDNKTLIIHPSSTIFCEFDENKKNELGVTDGLIRLAVGIEDAEDLIRDIEQAFKSL